MKIKPFEVEEWMNAYETGTKYNIAETCVNSVSIDELFELTGADKQAFLSSMCSQRLTYGNIEGAPELKSGICKLYKTLKPEEIVTTHGASGANHHIFYSLVEPGDRVISIMPTYQQLYSIPESFGADLKLLHLSEKNGFLPDLDELRALAVPGTKMICINNPNNPTGGVMDAADLEAIAEVLRGTNIMVLSDEIYAELTYGLERHISIATLPGMKERTIVVNGFSKAYAMTGWRLGYAVGPEPVIKVMTKIHQSCIMSAPTTSQYAAITALKDCDGEIERMRNEYNMRRRLVVKAFNDMGLTCFEPRGAFYAFPCIKSTGMSSQDFCTKLLEQKHVAIIPGDAFGASGEGYARISYAYSVEHLKEALRRIREFLQENGIYHGI